MVNTYITNVPTVGGDENTWGTENNANWDLADDLFDGTTAIAPNLVGFKVGGVAVTSTAAELNILDGVTSTAAELNVLDGIPATLTATELGYVDGVTSAIQTQFTAKAPLESPTFTGVPAAPTAALGTSTTQIATTAFALAQVIDEDSFATDSATRPPSQQSAKAYVTAQKIARFTGAQNAVAASVTEAHGLGAAPFGFRAVLVCATTDLGWAVGDEVSLSDEDAIGVSAATTFANATSVGVRLTTTTPRLVHKTGLTVAAITAGSWRVLLRAWL